MDLIGVVGLAVLGVLGAAATKLIVDEVKAWIPWVIKHLIHCAVRLLPEERRERFSEEWQSHVEEIPGDLGKLVVAIGFLSASWKMSAPWRKFSEPAFFFRIV